MRYLQVTYGLTINHLEMNSYGFFQYGKDKHCPHGHLLIENLENLKTIRYCGKKVDYTDREALCIDTKSQSLLISIKKYTGMKKDEGFTLTFIPLFGNQTSKSKMAACGEQIYTLDTAPNAYSITQEQRMRKYNIKYRIIISKNFQSEAF